MTQLADMRAERTDAELVAAVRGGDSDAYGELWSRHFTAARRLARMLVGADADADDVAAEAFARVLRAVKSGGGPDTAFRPYLLAAARRIAYDRLRDRRSQIPADEAGLPDHGQPFDDPAIARLQRTLAARAFLALPERWCTVLWHTDVERERPAEVARLLGLTPNGVSALRYRARERLRQEYLQLHLSERTSPQCRPVASMLGAAVRDGLARRDARLVDAHLRGCDDCRAAREELASINTALRGLLAPVLLGSGTAAYFQGPAGGASAAGGIGHAGTGQLAHQAGALRGLLAAPRRITMAPGRTTTTGRRLANALRLHPAMPVSAGLLAAMVAAPGTAGHLAASPAHRPGVAAAAIAPRSSAVRPGRSARPAPAVAGTAPAAGQSQPSQPGSPAIHPGHGVAVRLSAKLAVSVNVPGLLRIGLDTAGDVQVTNGGNAGTARVTARITLPPGLELAGALPQAGAGGWICVSVQSGLISCQHGPIAAGTAAAVSIPVLIVSLGGCESPVLAAVTAGRLAASSQSSPPGSCSPLL